MGPCGYHAKCFAILLAKYTLNVVAGWFWRTAASYMQTHSSYLWNVMSGAVSVEDIESFPATENKPAAYCDIPYSQYMLAA
jgi:hypothetical protein